MGGIAGIQYSLNSQKFDEQELLGQMLETIRHRAPYFQMHHSFEGISFGVRYHQLEKPSESMVYDNTRNLLVIVDGEILNVSEDFAVEGNVFNDAEIILKLYQKEDYNFLDKIDGQYAIAIWDGNQNRLLLARDRVGCKPLFYTTFDNGVVFASEIKAILATKLCPKSVDLIALNNFLSYWYVPNPDTLLNSVKQVRPGHLLLIEGGNIIEKSYWKFTYKQDEKDHGEAYYKEKLLDVFKNSVSRCIRKYPDCGAFLSGGLDSSSVVAVMHELKQSPFKVFSGGFKEEQYNEIGDAKVVADLFGLDLLSVVLEFNNDFPKLIEKLVWHHDAPFCDTSAIPSYFAAKLAKEHVNEVLTGDFPDQLLGGSGHYAKALKLQRNDSLVKRLLRHQRLNDIATHLPWSSGTASLFDRAKRMLYRDTFPIEEQRIILNMPVPELLKRCLYSTELLEINKEHNPLSYARSIYSDVEGYDLLDKLLYFDIQSYAPDDLMVKVDRMTMAHGLIAISPFHDRELVEFVATLPCYLKIKGEERKYIMKEALRPMLPEHTLNKKKKGFDMPIEEWLVKRHSNYVREILFDSRTLNRGYFNRIFLKKMVEDFLNKKTDYASGSAATIVSLITLELWHRLFID